MKPPRLLQPEGNAENTLAGNVSATVRYLRNHRAVVEHPAGNGHEDAKLTRERLRRRGFHVVIPHTTNHP